jgi:uncharacterized protein (DUF1330 family)
VSSFNVDLVKQAEQQGPVTMLNLVKYRAKSADGDGTGRDAYQRYTQRAAGYVERVGGKVLWAGVVGEAALQDGMSDAEVDWDWALLVYYPDRAAFLEMVTSPDYLEANEHRTNGLEKHAILATKTLLLESAPA